LSDEATVKNFIEGSEVALIYFGDSESDELYKAYKTVAMGIEGLAFGHVFGHESIRKAHDAKAHSVVLFKKFDEKRNDYAGSTSVNELKEFVNSHSFATVMKFDDRAIEKIF